MTSYNLPTVAVSLFFAGVILILVRRERLGILQTLWWLVSVAFMLFLGLVPSAVGLVGGVFGIEQPVIVPLTAGLCLGFAKILAMDAERARQERRIRILAQKMAAFDAEIRELKAQTPGESGGTEK